ncbi:universal stress protein [Streptomyces sp. NPDC057638]|uniref:universal stress protein n=1 Tax=Streptomyces sp. NPDC057638 TaxID=3346190 RepID=UPI0036AE072D
MAVVVWIVEGTWPACVDAARAHPARDGRTVLLYVTTPEAVGVARGAHASLLGRTGERPGLLHGWGRDPGAEVERLAADAADALLTEAAVRLGRPCRRVARTGRAEREVVAEAAGAELMICARDGDRTRLGPHSLGPATRYVVDHAPCPLLLVWPGPAPGTDTLPPPPERPPGRP